MKLRTLLAAVFAVALACPAYADSKISQFPMGGNLTVGDIVPVVRSGINYQTTYTGAASGVASFNTRTGTVTLTAPDVGAVLLTSASAHQFITGLNSSGVFTFAQPAFTDISGTISGAQLPTPTTSVLGGIIAQASATSHQVVQYINTAGQQVLAQLGFSDLSGTLSLAQLGASYTNGQVLIGSTTDGQFHAATLTAGTNVTIANAAGSITINSSGGGGSMVYPAAGIANSTGSAWGTSYTTSGSGTVIPLTVSPTFTGTVKTGLLTSSLNAASLPTALTGTVTRVSNVDATDSRFEVDAFGAVPRFSSSAYGGTAASPTAVATTTEIGGVNAWAYNGAATIGPLAALRFYTAQTQSSGHGGTYADIAVTPIGTTAMAEAMRFENDGGVTLPSTVTGGDKGAGTINASGLYVNGVAVGSGGGTPGGSSGQIQYNNSGAFGGLALGAGLTISSGVLGPSMPPSVKTADYPVATTDTFLALNSASPHTFTLPQAGTTGFSSGWCVSFVNYGTGVLTISPTTSAVNGAPTTLAQYGWAGVCSDGTNYEGQGASGGVALVQSLGSGLTLTSGVLSASGGSVTWPASGDIVVSNSTSSPAGIVPVNGDCVVASAGAWGAGSCSGTSSANLGTSLSATSPQISGDATTGLYTSAAAKVDVGISGSNVVEWGAGTETITGTNAKTLAVGANGATNPVLAVDDSTASVVSGVAIKGAATGVATTITATDSGSNAPLTIITKGTGPLILESPASGNATLESVSGQANLDVGGVNILSVSGPGVNIAPSINAGAATIRFKYNPAADTTLTASTNAVISSFAGAGITRQHATGSLALQEDYLFTGPTDSFVGASTETIGATMAFLLPGCGTNATCTDLIGLYHPSTALTVTGTTSNSYGLWLEADTGATNNYAANFKGDITLTGTAPTVTSCGSGSIVTGSSDHKGQISGVTTATTCTITFGQGPLGTAPACFLTGGTSGAVSGVYISAISTSAVTFTFSSYSGTLYYLCF